MQWRNTHLLLPPTSPLHQGCTARPTWGEGRREVPKLPYCLGERVQQLPSPVPAVQGRATCLNCLQPLHYLHVCVVGGTEELPRLPLYRS